MQINAQKIMPSLWFNGNAQEAVAFYTSIFPDSRIGRVGHYGEAGREFHQMPVGEVMEMEFELAGQAFLAINSGPQFAFTEAISFLVNCDTQEEVDHYWEKLSADGDPKAQMCGWLKDRYGVSWQIVPRELGEMIGDPHSEKSQRAFNAMLQMTKIDLAAIRQAYEGTAPA